MLRRQARLRREYLFKKVNESRHHKIKEKKHKLEKSLIQNKSIPGDLQQAAIQLQDKLKYDSIGIINFVFYLDNNLI